MASLTNRIDVLERNLIINGNMDFFQRGTSVAASIGGTYAADRFATQASSGFTVTASQSTDVPSVAQSGWQSRYSLLLTNGTGASPGTAGYILPQYRMEGQDYVAIHARKARIQF